jgi:hypothetical protein
MNTKLKMILLIAVLVIIIVVISYFLFIYLLVYTDSRHSLLYEDISDFEIQELFKNNRGYLLLSGNYLKSSSLSVKEVKENRKLGDVEVLIYTTTAANKNYNSSFIHAVKLDKTVNRILFGSGGKVI